MAGGPVEQYQYVQRKGSPKWIWFTLGSVGLAIAALLIFWLVSATVSESAKIDRMVSVADGIPAADWETTYSSDQKHGNRPATTWTSARSICRAVPSDGLTGSTSSSALTATKSTSPCTTDNRDTEHSWGTFEEASRRAAQELSKS